MGWGHLLKEHLNNSENIFLPQHRTTCVRGVRATCITRCSLHFVDPTEIPLSKKSTKSSPTPHRPQEGQVSPPVSAAGGVQRCPGFTARDLSRPQAHDLSSPSPEQILQRSFVLLPPPPPTFSLVSANNNTVHTTRKISHVRSKQPHFPPSYTQTDLDPDFRSFSSQPQNPSPPQFWPPLIPPSLGLRCLP